MTRTRSSEKIRLKMLDHQNELQKSIQAAQGGHAQYGVHKAYMEQAACGAHAR